jgi:hypothetical protein
VAVDSAAGTQLYPGTSVYYESSDCSGPAYITSPPVSMNGRFAEDGLSAVGDPLYAWDGPQVTFTRNSLSNMGGACQSTSPWTATGYQVHQAGVIAPALNGPLSITSAA